jgi:uncharacterized protein YbjQ (UPF0145 family)
MRGSVSKASLIVWLAVAIPSPVAIAADDVLMYPIAEAYTRASIANYVDTSVTYHFGASSHPRIAQRLGSYIANHRANAFGKGEDRSCPRAFLNAMLALQQRAKSVGANGVVNIVSYFRKKEVSSTTAFECHEGTLMSGVTLKGEMVRFAGR